MTRISKLLLIPALSFGFCLKAQAEGEQMGTFRFSEISLSPRGVLQEPSTGGFDLEESWISFEWSRDESLSGEISFGTGDLIAPAIWYEDRPTEIQLVQAAVQARSEYLDFRAGLLRIPNGYEGAHPEWEWSLPETRARSRRWFIRRDYGVEIKAQTKPFLASLTLHNGESGPNADRKMWVTGQWRYFNSEGFGILGTAATGQTGYESTNQSTALASDRFQFDALDSSKIRQGTIAFYRKWMRNLILAEFGRGEILQADQKYPFSWGHFDVCANLGGDLNLLARYEQTQASTLTPQTIVKSTGAGISVSSKDRLSSVTLWANKHTEVPEKQNDEVLLIFRLNSNYL